MNELRKTRTVLTAAVAALLAASASAQVAENPGKSALVGHKVIQQEQPRLPHAAEIPVRVAAEDLKGFEALLDHAIQDGRENLKGEVDYKELGVRRGAISRASDGGLFLALSFPPYEWPHGEGIQSVLTYMIHLDPQGRGTIKARENIYGRDCAQVAACEPVATEAGALQPFDAPRIMAQVKDFWTRAGERAALVKGAVAAAQRALLTIVAAPSQPAAAAVVESKP